MEFYQTYKEKIIYLAIVLLTVIVLHILTNLFLKKLETRTKRKYPNDGTIKFQLVKYILNALWLVLGIFSTYYLITSEDSYPYSTFAQDFKRIIYIGLVSVATLVSASTVNYWFLENIKYRKQRNSDTTNLRFIRYGLIVLIYIVGFFMVILAFPSLRSIAQTALGGAGILTIIVAVSSQAALSNIVSGLFIIFSKPFKVGDIIEIEGSNIGVVVDITLRHTVIRNFENKMIVIPNSIINKEKLINANMGEMKCCERIEIGISYDSDIDLAKKIMQDECENHILIIDNRSFEQKENKNPIVQTGVTALGDFSVTIRAWAWVANISDAYQIRRDIYESVKKRFDKEGIEIPYPYRTIVMKQEKK